MRRALVAFLVAGSACLAAGSACLVAEISGQGGLSKIDRDLYRQMLSDIRKDVEKNYYDPKLRGIDLAARTGEAAAKVAAAGSTAEAMEAITALLFDFNDSHTRFYPPTRATRTRYGWQMAAVGDAPLVVKVEPGSDAARRGLAPGDRVMAVNRFQPTRANLWQIKHYYGVVRPQVRQRVVVRKPDGAERVLDIESKVETRELVQAMDAIEEAIFEYIADADTYRVVEPGILVWRMARFGDADDMKPFIARARQASALVIDLRGNPGGQIDGLKGLVGMLFDREVLVMTRVSRKGEIREMARPKGTPFLGKLVVLVDSRSASASECLARIVQIEKRGIVIGDRSAGAVMASQAFSHGFGIGNTTFYATSVTVSDIRMSDGGSLETVGVAPDEVVLPTQADLAAGRDPALARALALAGGSFSPEQAGQLTFERLPR